MSTSLRIDNAELISGALVIGDTGGGVKGSNIPATGDSGPGYAYNDLTLPADSDKEIMGRVLTQPASGTLFTYEDTSFTFSAPDGTYSFTYQLYEDYVPIGGPATVILTIGGGAIVSDISVVSTLTAGLSTQIRLSTQSFGVTSITATLSTSPTGLSANLSGTAVISADMQTGASLSALFTSVSHLNATFAGTGSIKPGDKFAIEYLGKEYSITLI